MSKFLFVTDLDNTLVGDDAALERLNHDLSQHRQQYGTVIVYATGRSITLFNLLRTEKSLLDPDFRVLSVGTEIYADSDIPDSIWSEQLSKNWHRERVVSIAARFTDLVPQPPSEQAPFKVSFFLDPTAAVALPQLESALQSEGLEVQIIYSSNVDLDILPRRSNKGSAVSFLQSKLGFAPHETVFCGDSGNDLSMFQSVNGKGIIVGNAQAELLDWHRQNPKEDHYVARSPCAEGVLEGLQHFGFLPV